MDLSATDSRYLVLILPLPTMGGDQGEGDAFDIPLLHPHLTSPIKGEGPIGDPVANYGEW